MVCCGQIVHLTTLKLRHFDTFRYLYTFTLYIYFDRMYLLSKYLFNNLWVGWASMCLSKLPGVTMSPSGDCDWIWTSSVNIGSFKIVNFCSRANASWWTRWGTFPSSSLSSPLCSSPSLEPSGVAPSGGPGSGTSPAFIICSCIAYKRCESANSIHKLYLYRGSKPSWRIKIKKWIVQQKRQLLNTLPLSTAIMRYRYFREGVAFRWMHLFYWTDLHNCI